MRQCSQLCDVCVIHEARFDHSLITFGKSPISDIRIEFAVTIAIAGHDAADGVYFVRRERTFPDSDRAVDGCRSKDVVTIFC